MFEKEGSCGTQGTFCRGSRTPARLPGSVSPSGLDWRERKEQNQAPVLCPLRVPLGSYFILLLSCLLGGDSRQSGLRGSRPRDSYSGGGGGGGILTLPTFSRPTPLPVTRFWWDSRGGHCPGVCEEGERKNPRAGGGGGGGGARGGGGGVKRSPFTLLRAYGSARDSQLLVSHPANYTDATSQEGSSVSSRERFS